MLGQVAHLRSPRTQVPVTFIFTGRNVKSNILRCKTSYSNTSAHIQYIDTKKKAQTKKWQIWHSWYLTNKTKSNWNKQTLESKRWKAGYNTIVLKPQCYQRCLKANRSIKLNVFLFDSVGDPESCFLGHCGPRSGFYYKSEPSKYR